MTDHKDIEDEIEALVNKYNQQMRLPAFLSRMICTCSALAIRTEKEKGDGVDFINRCVSNGIFNAERLIKLRELEK